MDKFKEFWRKNKVLVVLGIILVICVVILIGFAISFFFGGEDTRPSNIDETISESVKKDYIAALEEDKSVEKVTFDVSKSGVIYIHINYVADTDLVDAQSLASNSLTTFSEDILNAYDINITIECEKDENSEGFKLIGARNVASKALNWDNNTPVESEE